MNNWQWLLLYINKIKWKFLFVVLFLGIEFILSLGLVTIQKYVIDNIFVNEKYDILWLYMIFLVGNAILYNFIMVFTGHKRRKTEYLLQKELVGDIFRHLFKLPIEMIQKQRTGKLVQNLTGDVYKVSVIVTKEIPEGIQDIISAIIIGIIIGLANPLILVFIIIISSVYIYFGYYYGPKVKKAAAESREEQTRLLIHYEEGISATKEIVAFNRQKWEKDKFDTIFKNYFMKVMDENRIANKQLLFTDPLYWLVTILVLGIGGHSVIYGNLSIGTFVLVYMLSDELMKSIYKVYLFTIGLSRSFATIERVREILEGTTIVEGHDPLDEKIHSLRFSNVSFRYANETDYVLKDLSMELPVGKKIALVGTSGGGKSTIVQLLARFHEPDFGEICVNNTSLKDINYQDWMSKISIVFQEPYFFPDTIKNNLLLGKQILDKQIEYICRKMRVHDYVALLPHKYEAEIGERGITLSGGQRQRLALARAILSNSEILILDESTSALDTETEHYVQSQMDELRKNKTTIVIAHRLSTIINADIIFVLDKGKVVESGTHTELLSNGRIYQDLVRYRFNH